MVAEWEPKARIKKITVKGDMHGLITVYGL